MAIRRVGSGTFSNDDWVLLTEFIRLEWFGYVRYRDLIVGGSISFVLLTGVIATLPLDTSTVQFLVTLTVIALVFAMVGGTLAYNRRIAVYAVDGLYIARHRETRQHRHGPTPEEAVQSLTLSLEIQEAPGPQ